MNYYFPLWQGSGADNFIYHGAKMLWNRINKWVDIIEVTNFINKSSKTKNNIQNYDALLNNLHTFGQRLLQDNPDKVFTLGGDCSLEIIPISYLYKKYATNLTILWFDAHADINTPETSPSKTLHGMPVRILIGEGSAEITKLNFTNILPKDIVYLGTRDIDPPEAEYIGLHNIIMINAKNIPDKIDALLAQIKDNVYIHIDLDILDPKELPGVMCPANEGIDKNLLVEMVTRIKNTKEVVGGSILEFTGGSQNDIEFASKLFSLLVSRGF